MFKKPLIYAFILGHVPRLSQAEITEVLSRDKIKFQELFFNSQAFLINSQNKLDVIGLQQRLGGTVKIVSIVYKCSKEEISSSVARLLSQRLKSVKETGKKFQFGFSLYGAALKEQLTKTGLEFKRKLQLKGDSPVADSDHRGKVRLVVSKSQDLSSVIVSKEKLIDQGADIVVVADGDDYYLGYTLTVQDYKNFSFRDFSRPFRDDKSGLLPPKLAKMMINLSSAAPDQIILDPFCGSGTVIQEALILGFKNLIASDVSQKAVRDTTSNLNWLQSKYHFDVSAVKIFQLDARELADVLAEESVDFIVTEPYLGPAEHIEPRRIKEVIDDLSELYLKSFASFFKVLKNGGRVVIILPVINSQALDILPAITSLGFKINKLSGEARPSLVYSRPGQRVVREIFVFEKISSPG
jgi:tRNA (guanine10-N2)-dimethyltransferase